MTRAAAMRLGLQYLPADILGLEEWASAILATRPRPTSMPGMVVPDTLDAVPALENDLEPEARLELAQSIERALLPFTPHVRTLEAVRALRQPGAAVVVAGQQPGFLGGPLYDVYKALTAIRLARDLSARGGAQVLPVFWNHADDHDIAEVHHLWIQNPNLDLRKVGLAGVSSGRTPLSGVRFDAERSRLGAIAEVLHQNLPPSDERGAAIELFLPRDGESFSNAFTRVLLELFGQHGLIVVEPDWIRGPLSRSLAALVGRDVAPALHAGSAALAAVDRAPAIEPEGAALLFHHEEGRRRALRLFGSDYRYDGEEGSRTAAELAAEILQEPEAWSSGALLRPLVQDATLPAVAYVGGWGELAYHAQLPPLRRRAGVPITAFVPRLSATVLDAATVESLDRLGLDAAGALRARGRLGEGEESEGESPTAERLRAAAARAAATLLEEREPLAEVDRGLAQQLRKAAHQMEAQVEKIAGKANRVSSNTQGGRGRHLRRVNNALYPREEPQERVHGVLGLVARYGSGWIDQLLEEIDPLPTEHLLVTVSDEDVS